MSIPKKRILCVEDDSDTCELVATYLELTGYEVITAHSFAEALEQVRDGHFDLYFIDKLLPDGSGLALAHEIRTLDSETPIIFHSASAYAADIAQGLEAGAQAYITKPSDPNIVLETIAHHITGSEIGQRRKASLEEIFARSEAILQQSKAVQRRASEVAQQWRILLEQSDTIVENARKVLERAAQRRNIPA